MNETSPLLNNHQSSSINDEVIPQYIRNSNTRQRFKWAIPSQETEEANKDRFFSIKICYVCMFLTAVSFTITITSMWPFLQIIDKTTDTAFLGWIVSAFSFGQLLSSPFFGYLSNKMNCHKIPMLICLFITIVGNLLYFYLESMKHIEFASPKYWMLVSRFIQGAGAACAAVIRSYVSSATNVQERTSALANLSACQGLGFIIGPVLQAALVPINYPGLNSDIFHFNMYTSPAFLSMLIYLILTILIIYKFTEYVVLDYETQDINRLFISTSSINQGERERVLTDSLKNLPPPDYQAIILALILFFINCFVFSFYETLSSPLTIDMYAWSKKEATLYNGIILGGFGIFAVAVVLVTKILARKFKEKILMLVGYVLLFVSVVILLPWGHNFPSVQIPTIEPGHKNTTAAPFSNTTTTTPNPITDPPPRGCPLDYDWCYYTPIVELYQLLLGFAVLVCGYSIANVMSFAIYSKLLGPKPQGTMMGLLTGVGSLSRAVGPIVVSYLYGAYGPRVSFITLGSIIFMAILIIILTIRKYEPYRFA